MTNKELFKAVSDILKEGNYDVAADFDAYVEKIENKQKSALKRRVEKRAESNLPIVKNLVDMLAGKEPQTVTEIVRLYTDEYDEPITTQKATAILRKNENKFKVTEGSIKGKGKVNLYQLV